MDNINKIPETMEEVQTQVVMMQQTGFEVAEEDVIKESIKNGFQSLLDERMSGHYYTVHWNPAFTGLDVIGFGEEQIGLVEPVDNQLSWVEQFRANADAMWFNLDEAAGKLIGR
ncbi:hypothetical protein [Weissella koreensis]|uniref:Uncharacterized protein n=1 Tax=Weissella koreensis TaxID=165096 RepID=A0A7H1MM23_9LACO|nr:hypothetical protein [Weissella koreensis]AVH75305.1 hypothetical protein C4597_04420 [Weissella koreensis]EJF34803.1 hypothetical protein JC2156_11150 [Weissella koreensis KCTC 3621]QGN20531.1 hypothetical protein GKC51_04405 [Weissella koreensis]QNT64509.1 hypothetical protein FY536_04135 [Weissella koreensis]